MSDNFVKLVRYVELKKIFFSYEMVCSIHGKFGVYLITCLYVDTLFIANGSKMLRFCSKNNSPLAKKLPSLQLIILVKTAYFLYDVTVFLITIANSASKL